ncbi:MAG: bifunctional metallophosphatase/5'-nucleotidase [Clostridiales bacterium]|nr:bifunctional metallophosphatase/5'-nucleotidase [Candidatus Blautia equi]
MKKLKIYFTSDTHGYLSSVDYASGKRIPAGVANCAAGFHKDGNTLILDGGDTIQGSPMTYHLHKSGSSLSDIAANVMNLAGYQFVTLGNHDFNYGQNTLQRYLDQLRAECLCANVEGLSGVKKTAVVTMENGLKVGLTGVTTHYINIWEKPENLAGITITEPVSKAGEALELLKAEGCDVTICIYHGGFENDLETGRLLSQTDENLAYRMCKELDFDIMLTGHQHIPMEDQCVFGTYVCQTPDKGKQYIQMDVEISEETGSVTARSRLCTPEQESKEEIFTYLLPYDEETAAWLDTPVGHLDVELLPEDHIKMASEGNLIANFFNQVQLEASGADISVTSLGNEVKGFDRDVTLRDIVATYIYPNVLMTLEADRNVLKQTMERCAEYFDHDAEGQLCVSETFLKPKVEHYNYDFVSGLELTIDSGRPVGDRIISMKYQGKELEEDRQLSVCMNNYRSTGTGGFDAYRTCPVLCSGQTEIVELLIDYVERHGNIVVDKTKWVHVI